MYLQLNNEEVASDPQDIISFLRNAKAEKAPRIPLLHQSQKSSVCQGIIIIIKSRIQINI